MTLSFIKKYHSWCETGILKIGWIKETLKGGYGVQKESRGSTWVYMCTNIILCNERKLLKLVKRHHSTSLFYIIILKNGFAIWKIFFFFQLCVKSHSKLNLFSQIVVKDLWNMYGLNSFIQKLNLKLSTLYWRSILVLWKKADRTYIKTRLKG